MAERMNGNHEIQVRFLAPAPEKKKRQCEAAEKQDTRVIYPKK